MSCIVNNALTNNHYARPERSEDRRANAGLDLARINRGQHNKHIAIPAQLPFVL